MSWFAVPGLAGYQIAKAAAWALTNGLRMELAEQGTRVHAVHLGAADTDFSADYDGPKLPAGLVASILLDGVESDRAEVLVDDWTRAIKAALPDDATSFAMSALDGGK